MEIISITVAVIVIILYVRSCNKKTIRALDRLKSEIDFLKEHVNVLKTSPLPPPEKAKEEISAVVPEEEPLTVEMPDTENRHRYMPPQAADRTIIADETVYEMPPPPETGEQKTAPAVKKDFERLVGVNLLSKIGIVTLVLGIGYFVKYAIDQHWINELGRVALGILCGGIIIATAHRLKDRYRTFSSILVGGGISVLYITIMIAFRDYELFPQTTAFAFLILITAFAVFLSLLYDRKELAVLSLLGGFASPLMVSSGSGNYVVLFTYLLILNAGMLALAFKKRWRAVGMTAYVLTLIFYWSWLLLSFRDEYVGAACFIFLFFVQFYILALADHAKGGGKFMSFHAFILLSNNLSLFAAGIHIYNSYPAHLQGIIAISIAVLNAIPMALLSRNKTGGGLVHLLVGIVLTFASLAIPLQFDGCAITLFWAAETTLLLWMWQKSGLRVFKVAFLAVELLALGSLWMDWKDFYMIFRWADLNRLHAESMAYGAVLPVIFNKPFITGSVVAATVWLNARLLGKEGDGEFLWGLKRLNRLFAFAGLVLLFMLLFLELQYQMGRFFEVQNFRFLIYGLYVYLFAGTLTAIRRNKKTWRELLYVVWIVGILMYVSIYIPVIFRLRGDVMYGSLTWGYFFMHYPALLSLALSFIFLIRNRKNVFDETRGTEKDDRPWVYWFVAIISVIILSTEADHLLLFLFFNGYNSVGLLSVSHNIVYPVLWGVASFALMITGMQKKNRTLRIISLSLFALIIAKLYLYDIWQMSQTGRIIALVVLGILLLLVSFLYQKLKVLFRKEEKDNRLHEEEFL
jgi:hypothetical protein